MIFYIIRMICEAHPVMFDRFLGLQAPTKCAQKCKTQLFCAMYDTQHKPIQPSAFSEKQNTGSLTVAWAVYQASAPGVTPFQDFIRSREANKTQDWAQHVSKTLHTSPQFGQAEAGKETNWVTHGRIGPLNNNNIMIMTRIPTKETRRHIHDVWCQCLSRSQKKTGE